MTFVFSVCLYVKAEAYAVQAIRFSTILLSRRSSQKEHLFKEYVDIDGATSIR